MSIETLLIITAVIVGLWLLYKLQLPKARTRELAMIVWSSFGPYSRVDDAEKNLRLSCEVVFGKEESEKQHEEWIKEHVDNFKIWEKEGDLESALNMMTKGLIISARGPAFNEAYQKFHDEIMSQGLEAMESLNKEFLEEGGHRLEAEKQEDGSTQFVYKKILSDEEIEQKEKERNQTILKGIGQGLLEKQTEEAELLVEFMKKVWKEEAGEEIETPEKIGQVWLGLTNMANEDPDSDISKTFTQLNKAAIPTELEEDENE